ncbi:MAG: hypothetical protein IPL19_09085 [Sandaracinaceae bacterium]|nr:hypothetical protein [Sandaracinaceae bacterium]
MSLLLSRLCRLVWLLTCTIMVLAPMAACSTPDDVPPSDASHPDANEPIDASASADAGLPPPFPYAVAGAAVVKVRRGAGAVVLLEETLVSLSDPGPRRRMTRVPEDGGALATYSPPDGWFLLDFALHPSGQVSVVIASEKTLRLVRLDTAATVIAEHAVDDPLAATDPIVDTAGVFDSTSMLPRLAKDAARLAPVGEDLVLAVRTGRHATIAYRYGRVADSAGGFAPAWRTLVEPGTAIGGRFLTGGSFDTFEQLIKPFPGFRGCGRGRRRGRGGLPHHVGYRARFPQSALQRSHSAHDARCAGHAGRERWPTNRTTAVDTIQTSEVHGLRVGGGRISLVGRVRSERLADGTGWNAYAAFLAADGTLAHYQVIDVHQGDILFDIVPARDGRWLAAGAAGYVQNPYGASITAVTDPLLLELEPDGNVFARHAFVGGPRQNQLRSLDVGASANERLVGGLQNGPGTHTGDADPSLITADGLVRTFTLLDGAARRTGGLDGTTDRSYD